ncbi:MAG: DUF2851 family protein [Chloroflexota bacterium]|nr:DUF2851 family protein [Chloroflexota bacterium]MDE2885286.1 DUF2851 family protein [Chloroflexota bacterium]
MIVLQWQTGDCRAMLAEERRRYGARRRTNRSVAPLPEHLLARLWRAKEGRSLRTVDGRRVKVLYAGRPAPGHGPDFQDAVVRMDGERTSGNVELHRKPSDWHAHGHDADPAYDDVVLHIVAQADERGPDLPLAELSRPGAREALEPPLMAGLARVSSGELRQTLMRSGIARFRERIQAASRSVAASGAKQALHEALFVALGYAENRAPFHWLARAVPAAVLRQTAGNHPPEKRRAAFERILLDASGLEGGTSPEGAPPWKTAGVRPANHPRQRVRGAAALLARVSEEGLLAACERAVAEGGASLEALFVVDAPAGALIGTGRAREIVVNAALPLLAATGNADAEGLFLRHPALPENSLTREARRLTGARGMRLSACEQMGLLRLYRGSIAGD